MPEMTVRAQKVAGGMLALTASAHFLNDMIQSVIPASFPVIKANYALTFAEIALIGAALQLTASVLQPFIGAACDRKPRPYSLVFGMMLTFTGLILLTRAPSFELLVAATALIGCGSAVFHPEASRAAQTAGAGRKALAQAVFQLGGNAGSAVGPLAAAFVLAAAGQQGIGWFAAAAVLAAILLVGVARAGRRLRSGVKKVSASVVSVLPESVVRKAFLLLFCSDVFQADLRFVPYKLSHFFPH